MERLQEIGLLRSHKFNEWIQNLLSFRDDNCKNRQTQGFLSFLNALKHNPKTYLRVSLPSFTFVYAFLGMAALSEMM